MHHLQHNIIKIGILLPIVHIIICKRYTKQIVPYQNYQQHDKIKGGSYISEPRLQISCLSHEIYSLSESTTMG